MPGAVCQSTPAPRQGCRPTFPKVPSPSSSTVCMLSMSCALLLLLTFSCRRRFSTRSAGSNTRPVKAEAQQQDTSRHTWLLVALRCKKRAATWSGQVVMLLMPTELCLPCTHTLLTATKARFSAMHCRGGGKTPPLTQREPLWRIASGGVWGVGHVVTVPAGPPPRVAQHRYQVVLPHQQCIQPQLFLLQLAGRLLQLLVAVLQGQTVAGAGDDLLTCWWGPGEVSTGRAVVKKRMKKLSLRWAGSGRSTQTQAWPPLLFADAGAKEEDEQIRSGRKK